MLPVAKHCMSIREARIDDVGDLVQLEKESFHYDVMSRSSFLRLIKKPTVLVLVSEMGETITGFIIVLMRKNSLKARIYSLAVSEAHRGNNIGCSLIEAALCKLKALGKQKVGLEVRVDNQPAIALYERLHFQPKAIKHQYYDDGQDALRYELFF